MNVNLTFSDGMETDVTTPDSDPLPPGYYREQSENMWTYIPPVIIVWGTVGNVLTIVILLRQLRRLSSTAMYLLALAVSDLMILWLGPLRKWILTLWEEDVRLMTVPSCRIQTFLTYVTVQVSSWLLAAVSMERMLSVLSPHRVRILCTPRRAAIVVAVIVFSLCGLNSHYLWNIGFNVYVPYLDRSYDCIGTTDSYRYFSIEIWPWVDFIVAFLAPFVVLIIGNIAIILKLGRRVHKRRTMSHGKKHLSVARESRTITLMLVTLSIVFVICMTPVSVYYICLPYIADKVRAITDPVERWEARGFYIVFIQTIVNNIMYINASFNFVLYVLSGSRFRNELKLLLTCRAAPSDGAFGSSTVSSRAGAGSPPTRRTRVMSSNPTANGITVSIIH